MTSGTDQARPFPNGRSSPVSILQKPTTCKGSPNRGKAPDPRSPNLENGVEIPVQVVDALSVRFRLGYLCLFGTLLLSASCSGSDRALGTGSVEQRVEVFWDLMGDMPVEVQQRFDELPRPEADDDFDDDWFYADFNATPHEEDPGAWAREAWQMHDALEQHGFTGVEFRCDEYFDVPVYTGGYRASDGAVLILEWSNQWPATARIRHPTEVDGSPLMKDQEGRPEPVQCLPEAT